MPHNEPSAPIRQFLGLRNTDRPATLPPGSLVEATNIDIDDQQGIERRKGYALISGLTDVTAAYSTRDEKDLYVVDGGILKRVLSTVPVVTEALATGIGPGEVWWDDHGGYVFCSGAFNGVIHAGTFTAYADFGSADDLILEAQGYELATDEADIGTLPPPDDTQCVTYFEGSVWLSYYDTVSDQSFIFKSKPFFWSRYDLATDYAAIPGQIVTMAAAGAGVVIGTTKGIWVYSQDTLQAVAEYPAIPGPAKEYENRIYFWTQRGLCRALPFENLTEEGVSVPSGTKAALAVSREEGRNTVLVVTTGGGEADNAYAG